MAFKLAELFVEFTTKGVGTVKSGIDAIKGSFAAVAGPVAAAAAAVSAFAAAGLVGTAQGDRLAGAFQHFSQTVASLFLPVFETAGELVRRFSEALSESVGAQAFQRSKGSSFPTGRTASASSNRCMARCIQAWTMCRVPMFARWRNRALALCSSASPV